MSSVLQLFISFINEYENKSFGSLNNIDECGNDAN